MLSHQFQPATIFDQIQSAMQKWLFKIKFIEKEHGALSVINKICTKITILSPLNVGLYKFYTQQASY